MATTPRRKSKVAKKKQPSTRAGSAARRGATAPPAAGKALWTPQGHEVGIRVRMYRVGFGDFFLLTCLQDVGDPVHIVIDCGVFKGTSQTGDIGSIEAAVADMVATTAQKVALIMVTHRHADHIAGFARCAADFKSLSVQSIWMSIWESEYSATAVKYQADLTRTAMKLQDSFTAMGVTATDAQRTARKYMENATGAGQTGSSSNAAALDMLKHGFKGVTPDYYQGGSTPKLPPSMVEAGITAQIFGPPPVADLKLMQLMDLTKGVDQYLAEVSGEDTPIGARPGSPSGGPFAAKWEVQPLTHLKRRVDRNYDCETYREWLKNRDSWNPLSVPKAQMARARMEKSLVASQPAADLVAAKQLNSFLNNQSLVVLFTIKGKKLLFVGDAQAGNWEHWLFDTDNANKSPGMAVAADAKQILSSLDFYKVGHHGSGNATPKAAVETMALRGRKFAAMCSTQAGVYGTEDPDDPTKGTEVPRGPLIDKLATETAFVRSDQIQITVNDKVTAPEVTVPLPSDASGVRFERGPIWIDCYL